MNDKQKVWAVILSIVIAVLPLLALEDVESFSNAQHQVYDLLQMFINSLQTSSSSDLDKGKQMALGFIVLALLYLLLYLGFFIAGTLLYLLLSSSWRKPVVFISYKIPGPGDEKNTASIAKNISKALLKMGFKVRMQPTLKNPRHDVLNHSIKTDIRQCGALIAVPHASGESSYVDAEIACAYHNDKPVYIIRHSPGQKLPATANSGHIVFNLQKLQNQSYKPLNNILPYIHGYLPRRAGILVMPFEGLFPFEDFPFNTSGFMILSFLLALIASFVNIQVGIVKIPMYIAMILLGLYCAWQTLEKIFTYINLQHNARQTTLSDQPTYLCLEEAEEAKDISKESLGSIEKKGLEM